MALKSLRACSFVPLTSSLVLCGPSSAAPKKSSMVQTEPAVTAMDCVLNRHTSVLLPTTAFLFSSIASEAFFRSSDDSRFEEDTERSVLKLLSFSENAGAEPDSSP